MALKKEVKKAPVKNLKDVKITETLEPNKVVMVFKEHKYYNDLDTPIFEAGKPHTLEGADWIQRWLKRGGEIIEGQFVLPSGKTSPSKVVGSMSDVATQNEKLEDIAKDTAVEDDSIEEL